MTQPQMKTLDGLAIARGMATGVFHENMFGRNPSAGAGAVDLIDQSGVFAQPTADRIHDVASSSANDDSAAGTGAQTIRILGISGGVLTQEDLPLDGLNDVPTDNAYGHIYRMDVLTVGGTGATAGTVSATAQVDATVTCRIRNLLTNSFSSAYQVPAGKQGFVVRLSAGFLPASAAIISLIRLEVNLGGGPSTLYRRRAAVTINSTVPFIERIIDPPIVVPALGVAKLVADSSAGSGQIYGQYDIVIA